MSAGTESDLATARNERRQEQGEEEGEADLDAGRDGGASEKGRDDQQAGDARAGNHPGKEGALDRNGKRHRDGYLEHNHLNWQCLLWTWGKLV